VFTNTKIAPGEITIEKQTEPADTGEPLTSFGFSGDAPLGDFELEDGGTKTVTDVSPGSYGVTEADEPGYELSAISCSDADSTGSLAERRATIEVDPGESVSCVFTNTKIAPGEITIEKQTEPADTASPKTAFSFTADAPLGDFALEDDGTKTVTVEPGAYLVTEADAPGYELSAVSCSDDDSTGSLAERTATIKVAAGESVHCTFINSRIAVAEINIEKQTQPADTAELKQAFSFSGDAPLGNFTLADDVTKTVTVEPGTYLVTEAVAPGYEVSAVSCSDTDSTGSLADRRATIRVAAGESVRCVFTNVKAGKITVEKQTEPADTASRKTAFSFTGDAPLGKFTLTDDGTKTVTVKPGTYNVKEAAPTGDYYFSSIRCNDSDSTSTSRTAVVRVAPGETVNCTFTNAKYGTITVAKETVPDDTAVPKTAFSFKGGTPLGNFTLVDKGTKSGKVKAGDVAYTEALQAGYTLTSIRCSDSDSSPMVSRRKVRFAVAIGEQVTCTFTNTKNAGSGAALFAMAWPALAN
jgi:uncharacterized cupredoxin-like copper-binding protein